MPVKKADLEVREKERLSEKVKSLCDKIDQLLEGRFRLGLRVMITEADLDHELYFRNPEVVDLIREAYCNPEQGLDWTVSDPSIDADSTETVIYFS